MAIHEIRVRNVDSDIDGELLLNELRETLGNKRIRKIRTARIFRLEGVGIKDATTIAEKLLSESINQEFLIEKPFQNAGSKRIEIAYKPGVMNPEAASIVKAARDLGIKPSAADSSHEFYFFTDLSQQAVEELVVDFRMFNPLIEQIVKDKPKTLLTHHIAGSVNTVPLRNISDDGLMKLSKDKLFLNLEEMKVVQNYFKTLRRDPTDAELETIAQSWSEHCAHKTFKANLIVDGRKKEPLIKRLMKESFKHHQKIISSFIDNSGVMDFYEGYAICGKAETHNSPSAIEPYGGAMTGSGGVFRDIIGTGLGAKTIASTDIFCFADPSLPPAKLPPGCLPPGYLLKRVVKGVRDYGNRMGIPTNNGSVHFHNDFRAKPTIIVGAYGIVPKKYAKKREPVVGDLVVLIGGKTGRDGIHGATFSSGEMDAKTISTQSTSVQIGNAIEEKRMFDAILEARNNGCFRAIQDIGGGGLSSAFGEMGENGANIDLSRVPLKYPGLAPWEIWISESQERMAFAVQKAYIHKFKTICRKYNVEIAVLGTFDGSKKLRLTYGSKKVCNLDMKFIHHGLPQRTMIATKPDTAKILMSKRVPAVITKARWIPVLKKVLAHGNVCSKEPIIRQYDHTVQGTNVLQPFVGEQMSGPTDAAVLRPLLNKPYGIVLSHGLNPALNLIDPYHGTVWSAIEALTNYVAVGGDYKNASLINNYIWPVPDEASLWSLDQSVTAVTDIMKVFHAPVISGKDSLSSTYRNPDGTILKIPPVLCMSVFGRIPDVSKTVSSDFKNEKSVICLVGKPDVNAMGGSVYFETQKLDGVTMPHIDLAQAARVFNTIHKGIVNGKIISCHDVSEGGVVAALFEMCLGGGLGAQITIPKSVRPDFYLFNETAGTLLVEVQDTKMAKLLFGSVPYTILGKTTKEKSITSMQKNKVLFTVAVSELKKAWQKPMKILFP